MPSLFLCLCLGFFVVWVGEHSRVSAAVQDSYFATGPLLNHLQKLDKVKAHLTSQIPTTSPKVWPDSDAMFLLEYRQPLLIKYAAIDSDKYQELCNEIRTLKILNVLGDTNFPPMVGFFYYTFMQTDKVVDFTGLVLVLDPFTNNGAFQTMRDCLEWPMKIAVYDLPTIILELASQINNLHNIGIVHCDIKLENIAMAGRRTPKIIDFGLAHLIDTRAGYRTFNEDLIIGTPAYVAPEMFFPGYKTPKVDWYSLGIAVFRIYAAANDKTALIAFDPTPYKDQVSLLKAEGVYERQWILRTLTNIDDRAFAEMVAGLLETNPDCRWSYDQMIRCNYLKSAYEQALAPSNQCAQSSQ